jgi:hypothetical protein
MIHALLPEGVPCYDLRLVTNRTIGTPLYK